MDNLNLLLENARKAYDLNPEYNDGKYFENVIVPLATNVYNNLISKDILPTAIVQNPVFTTKLTRLVNKNTKQLHKPLKNANGLLEDVPGYELTYEDIEYASEIRSYKSSFNKILDSNSPNIGKDLVTPIKVMREEIDQQIINELMSLCPEPTAANTFDTDKISSDCYTVVDEFASLAVLMNRQANLIAVRTRAGKGNWALVSRNALTILESAKTGAFRRNIDNNNSSQYSETKVGMVENIQLFVNNSADDKTPVLIGYKGEGYVGAASFNPYFLPYVKGNTTPYYIHRFALVKDDRSPDYLGLVGINPKSLSFL